MESECLREIRNQQYIDSELPLVSVATIAYNVGRFLEECIESVLMQKTSFRVELVIGEDCSTDNTRDIALKYQQKYPQIIRVLLPEKNQGLTPNSIATQNACKGKYIALLDGDDFWTDTMKLQRQIDFLEDHLDFSGSAHQAWKIYEDGSPSVLFGEQFENNYVLKDMLTHRKFHTSSLVYRKELWIKTGGIPSSISSNERALYPMITLFGSIKYFKDPMCVYRMSSTNLSSRIDYKELEKDLAMLPWLRGLNRSFPVSRFRSFLHQCMFTYGNKIPLKPLLKHYLLFSFFSFSYFPKNFGDLKWGTIFFIRRIK